MRPMNALPLRIALRYMFSKKSHTAVSIISAISVCAVAVTAMAMICILSVFNGFSRLVDSKLSSLDPQLKAVAAEGKIISDADSLIRLIRGVEGVRFAVPTISDKALAVYGDKQVPITLKGVTDDYSKLNDIESLVKEDGQYVLSYEEVQFAVVSVGTAVALDAHPGYSMPLELYAPKRRGAVNPANPMSAFRSSNAYISGVFEVQQAEYDNDLVIVPIDIARRLFDYSTEASAIEIAIADGVSEADVAQRIQKLTGDKCIVQTRLMQHSGSLKMINMEKWVTFLLLGFILIIASFNIISTLTILIIEKDESIRTLRSMGADNRMISRIFIAEGWLISIAGAATGIIAGVILCLLQQWFGLIKISSDTKALIIDSYPVAVEFTDVLAVAGIVAAVGFFTSWATAVAMRRRLSQVS